MSLVEAGPEQPHTILAPDGTVPTGYESPLDDAALLYAYRLMKLTRVFDTRAFNLQRQGRLGTFSQVTGQEASVVGSALALEPARDWVAVSYTHLDVYKRQAQPWSPAAAAASVERSRGYSPRRGPRSE